METSKSELEDMSDSVTCARLILGHQKVLFVKSNWFTDHFSLVAFDGENSWSLQASEEQIASRAEGWDKSVGEYMDICRRHLSQSFPASNYEFSQENNGAKEDMVLVLKGTAVTCGISCSSVKLRDQRQSWYNTPRDLEAA